MESTTDLTRESIARLRASNNKLTADVRKIMADDPTGDIATIGLMIVANLQAHHIAAAGIAALSTFDLAIAQGEIVRLQAELEGERAAHDQCHRDILRARNRGGDIR